MKLTRLTGVLIVLISAGITGCGSSGKSSPGPSARFRAFVSQDVSSTTLIAGLDVVDASKDRLVRLGVSAGSSPGLMEVSANKLTTLVFNLSGNSLNVINNKQESSAGSVTLPDWTESLAITSDATVAFAAVPNAPVAGQSPGAVEMISLSSTSNETPIPVPAVHYITLSGDNTHLLAFSDSPDAATGRWAVTVITLQNVGTTSIPNWMVKGVTTVADPGLDHPVWGVYSADGNTAYIMNCGPECGGTAASVAVLDLTQSPPVLVGSPISIPSATYGVRFGTTLYVVGTDPNLAASGTSCAGSNTAAAACGQLSIIDTAALQASAPIVITDGYHNRMTLTADMQLFIGARRCSDVNIAGGEQRGCLSIYNAQTGTVVIGTDHFDVTGIAPVTGRTEVYVVENGELRIWDTTKDALIPAIHQIDIFGHAVDVKIVD